MKSQVTTKGRIVIPAALRRKYGIAAGTKIAIYEGDGRNILQPITRETIHKVRGTLKGSCAPEALMADRERERDL